MRVIIIDDEKIAITVLNEMLKPYDNLNVVGTFTDPNDAYDQLLKLSPNVIFLDIELKNANGIEFAEKYLTLMPDIEIVFVTAYSEYAIEAFELNAVDYLLKPIQEQRLENSITRLNNLYPQETTRKALNQIRSFDKFELIHGEEPIKWRTQKAKELFIYLWIHQGQFITKEKLIDILYPDRDYTKSQSIFYTLIYQLRKTLADIDVKNAINLQNGSYRLDYDFESDVKTLLNILDEKSMNEETINHILSLYQGPFLESESYNWVHPFQTEINSKVINSLNYYIKKAILTHKINPLVERCIELLCEIDPYNEETHKSSMQYFKKTGQSQKAQAKQNHFINRLKDDLGIDYP